MRTREGATTVSISKHGGCSEIRQAMDSARDVLHGLKPHLDGDDDVLRPVQVWAQTEGHNNLRDGSSLAPGKYPVRSVGHKYVEIGVDLDHEHGGWFKLNAEGEGRDSGVIEIMVARSDSPAAAAERHEPAVM